MPRITILDRYIAREVLGPFALGVILLTFALVTGRVLKLTEMVVNHGVTVGEVLELIGYVMPAFFELTFPMAVLLGVLLGFGRMSGDREMIAARSCGVSLYRLAVPVLAVGFVVYVLSSWFAFSVRPWANRSLEGQLYHLTRTQASAALKEKIFNRAFQGLVIYVDQIEPGGSRLHGILISDARTAAQQNTIIAQRGVLLPSEHRQGLTLRLYNGSIFGVEPRSNAAHVTSFKVYDLTIEPAKSFRFGSIDPTEMSYSTLLADIRKARAAGKPDYDAEAELAGKYTVPLASLLFALLGIPLGLKPARGGQSERFGVAVSLFFLYYVLMKIGQTLAENGRLNAFVAMAIPDVVFIVLAVWLFVRAAEDRGDQGRGPADFIWEFIERSERSRGTA
jgi:lipopolysaccharide export system permease protein